MNATDERVLSFWVKSYDCFNRQSCQNYDANQHGRASVDFKSRLDAERFYFVQMGVRTTTGSLVLNEWRKSA